MKTTVGQKFKTLFQIIHNKTFGHYHGYPMIKPTETLHVEILANKDFQASNWEVKNITCLDTARLANLWQFAKRPGVRRIMEIGSYKGGGALHMSNANPNALIYISDTFNGFHRLDCVKDAGFRLDMFKDTRATKVKNLFVDKHRDVTIVEGLFHKTWQKFPLNMIDLIHLDVDTYESTSKAIEILASNLCNGAVIICDDYCRSFVGVTEAIDEHRHKFRQFAHIFPSQAILFV